MIPGTRLTIHAQSKADNFDRFIQEARPWYVKLMDWGTDWPYPDTRVILRMFEDGAVTSERVGRGEQGAREAFERWAPEWSKRAHYAWAIEDVANEPHPMNSLNYCARLDMYTSEMSRLFQREGWRYAGNLFSVGWPDVGRGHQFKTSMSVLAANGHLWGPHEYNNPTMQTMGTDGKPYWTGRFGATIKELRQAGSSIPAIYIGECGLDYGVSTPSATYIEAQKGWLAVNNDPDMYMSQLVWYDDILAAISNQLNVSVLTGCIYNSGSYPPWESFEVNDPLTDLLINRWQSYRGTCPETEIPPWQPSPRPPLLPGADHLLLATDYLQDAIDAAEAALSHIKEYEEE